jgi:hypothetical protein
MAKLPTPKNSDETWEWFTSRLASIGYDSLSSFCRDFDFQKSTLSRYFHRQREIPSGQIGKLCQTLKVSPEELLQAVGAMDWKYPGHDK